MVAVCFGHDVLEEKNRRDRWLSLLWITGGNRTMVAAATIVSMAAADGERISIFPLVCPNKARCVSFSAPDISFVKGRSLVITVDVAVNPSFLVIRCRKYSPSRWLQQMVTMVASDVPGGMTKVARQFWRTYPADYSRNMFKMFLKLSWKTL